MSELINKVKTKYEIKGEVQVAKVYPELENLTVTPAKTIQSFNHPDSYGYNNVVVKAIDCETLNVKPKKEEQAFDGMYDKVNVRAIDCETLNITPKKESQAFDGMFDKVNVEAMEVETLNITPTEETQTFNGLYETVNVGAIEAEEVAINPNFSTQDIVEVTSTEGEYLKKVTINKDKDLIPENIKNGVNIFGVVGISLDTSDATAKAEDILEGETAYVNGVKIEGTNIYSVFEGFEEPTGDDRKKIWIVPKRNLYNRNNDTVGQYIDANGQIQSSPAWNLSDYIKVEPEKQYTYHGLWVTGNAPFSGYFDENKNWVAAFKQQSGIYPTSNTITIPSGVHYVRFSIINGTDWNTPEDDTERFQIELGVNATSHTPYREEKAYYLTDNNVYVD